MASGERCSLSLDNKDWRTPSNNLRLVVAVLGQAEASAYLSVQSGSSTSLQAPGKTASPPADWETEFLMSSVLIFPVCFRPPEAVCLGPIPLGFKHEQCGGDGEVSHVITLPPLHVITHTTHIAVNCGAGNIFSASFSKIEDLFVSKFSSQYSHFYLTGTEHWSEPTM